MNEVNRMSTALDNAIANKPFPLAAPHLADLERVIFSAGFEAGWKARTQNTDAVMVTREYLADLERRVSIQERRAFMPRPDGSVS